MLFLLINKRNRKGLRTSSLFTLCVFASCMLLYIRIFFQHTPLFSASADIRSSQKSCLYSIYSAFPLPFSVKQMLIWLHLNHHSSTQSYKLTRLKYWESFLSLLYLSHPTSNPSANHVISTFKFIWSQLTNTPLLQLTS